MLGNAVEDDAILAIWVMTERFGGSLVERRCFAELKFLTLWLRCAKKHNALVCDRS